MLYKNNMKQAIIQWMWMSLHRNNWRPSIHSSRAWRETLKLKHRSHNITNWLIRSVSDIFSNADEWTFSSRSTWCLLSSLLKCWATVLFYMFCKLPSCSYTATGNIQSANIYIRRGCLENWKWTTCFCPVADLVNSQETKCDFSSLCWSAPVCVAGVGSSPSSQWDFWGSTLVTGSYVRLTPDERSKQGSIWNTVVRIHYRHNLTQTCHHRPELFQFQVHVLHQVHEYEAMRASQAYLLICVLVCPGRDISPGRMNAHKSG